jgi:hypothetical protein
VDEYDREGEGDEPGLGNERGLVFGDTDIDIEVLSHVLGGGRRRPGWYGI